MTFTAIVWTLVGVLLLCAGVLVVWLARDFIRDARTERQARAEAAHVADLAQGWEEGVYQVGTRRGTGFEWRTIAATWPEVSTWAETTSQDQRFDTAFVVQADPDAPGYVTEWEWTDGALAKHEFRKAHQTLPPSHPREDQS